MFGEIAILTDEPRTASGYALEDVKLRALTRDTLRESVGAGSWMGELVAALGTRFRERDEWAAELERWLAREKGGVDGSG